MKERKMEYSIRILGSLVMLLNYLLWPLEYFLSRKPKKYTPPINDSILLQSASSLAKKIRNKELKSEDVIKAYIKRIKEVNPILNAVVEPLFNDALNESKKVDELIASGNKTPEELENEFPFLGVPLTVKESCRVKGKSMAVGSLPRKGLKTDTDGEFVSLMRKAGAIPIVLTNTPELCLNWESWNMITGRTSNPYDTNRTSGGSSGGEGALLSSAASVIGIGSDLAGSIRVPAMFNGVFGHKPTGGICPVKGHYPICNEPYFEQILVLGPLTRYAEDLKSIMKVATGNPPHLKLDEKVDLHKLNIYTMVDFGKSLMMLPVQREIKKTIQKAAKYFKDDLGSNVYRADFIDLQYACELSCGNLFSVNNVPNLLEDPDNPKTEPNLVIELIKSILNLSLFTIPAICFQIFLKTCLFIPKSRMPFYEKQREVLIDTIQKHLGNNGVIICPTFPESAFLHNGTLLKITGVTYPMIFNVLKLPATHVPMGLDKNGLPIGFQVVAAPNQDRLCLAVAEELEKAFGGWRTPPDTNTN